MPGVSDPDSVASDDDRSFFAPPPVEIAMVVNSTNPEADGRDADNAAVERLEFKTLSKLKIRG